MLYYYLRTPYTFKDLWIVFHMLKFKIEDMEYLYEDETGFSSVK